MNAGSPKQVWLGEGGGHLGFSFCALFWAGPVLGSEQESAGMQGHMSSMLPVSGHCKRTPLHYTCRGAGGTQAYDAQACDAQACDAVVHLTIGHVPSCACLSLAMCFLFNSYGRQVHHRTLAPPPSIPCAYLSFALLRH